MQKKFCGLKGVGAAHKNQKRLEIIVLRAGQPLALPKEGDRNLNF